MVDNPENKEGKFDVFTLESKALVHISLDHARDNCDEGHCNSFAESLIS